MEGQKINNPLVSKNEAIATDATEATLQAVLEKLVTSDNLEVAELLKSIKEYHKASSAQFTDGVFADNLGRNVFVDYSSGKSVAELLKLIRDYTNDAEGVGAATHLKNIRAYVNPATPLSNCYAKNITTTTEADIVQAGGIGVKNYINQILVTNGSSSTGTIVDIIEHTTGLVLYTGYAAANGGFSVSLPTPLVQSTANTKLQAKCTTAGADVTVSVNGFKI